MKERILYGWSLRRVLYLVMGIVAILFFISEKQWLGLLPAGYFFAMGLFRFGCAGGSCRL